MSCDHVVSFYESDYDSGSWLQEASSIETWDWSGDGERFAFCPHCGAALAGFWKGIDAAREAQRRRERQAREIENIYSNTPPS